jgi:hypothetical protein
MVEFVGAMGTVEALRTGEAPLVPVTGGVVPPSRRSDRGSVPARPNHAAASGHAAGTHAAMPASPAAASACGIGGVEGRLNENQCPQCDEDRKRCQDMVTLVRHGTDLTDRDVSNFTFQIEYRF